MPRPSRLMTRSAQTRCQRARGRSHYWRWRVERHRSRSGLYTGGELCRARRMPIRSLRDLAVMRLLLFLRVRRDFRMLSLLRDDLVLGRVVVLLDGAEP